jgi:hypothetical protein
MNSVNIPPNPACRPARRLPALALALCGLAAGASEAATVDVYYRVEAIVVAGAAGAPGIFGNQAPVTMWGYVPTDSSFQNPPAGTSGWTPPAISAAKGDTLAVHLSNALTGPYTEPTSVIVPGQPGNLTPTFTDGSSGARTSPAQRVRSFAPETPVGGEGTYTFGPLLPGTYLLQTGTHPGVQLQMGLYASLRVYDGAAPVLPATAGQAYDDPSTRFDNEAILAYDDPSTRFDNEAILLFSEVDAALHSAVEAGSYGATVTSPVDYSPVYWLVNGSAYPASGTPMAAGHATQTTLLRLLNAGIQSTVVQLVGGEMSQIAEDGNPYSATGVSLATDAPGSCAFGRLDYQAFLPAGKTMDSLWIPAAPGNYPVFARRDALTNAGVSPGGALAYLSIPDAGAATIPAPTPCAFTAAAAPLFTVAPASLSFPAVRGTTSPGNTVTVANVGSGSGMISGVSIVNGTGSFSASTHFNVSPTAVPITVAADGSAAFSVSFSSNGSASTGTRTATLKFTTNAAGSPTLSVPLSVNLVAPLSITTSSLANATVAIAYSRNVAATGGVPAYAFSVSAGSLPPGLSLSPSGTISGVVPTGTASATYAFTVMVADTAGNTATRSLSIRVVAPLAITTTSPLPNATRGSAYSVTLAGTGGSGTYTWTRTSGSLPPGLTLSSSTGKISGTVPTTATPGTRTFTIRLSDNAGTTPTSTVFSITVL